ncbi:hypothetical protein BKA80DRAFT_283783 [Phyllosticta citrichinensis]
MPARLRPAGVRSLNASLIRPPRRLLMLSVARPLAPRQGFTAAFIASPTTSFRSFATTTTTTTNDTATSDTSPTSPGQHGSITRDPPTAPAPVGIAPLPHRRIICVAGEMTTAFLNGLTTNKIPSWIKQIEEGFRGLYTGILNAQGRVMFDAFIYPTTVVNKDGEPVRACYVEFDEALGTQPMFLLKRYRLRAKVTLEYARDRGVFCAWGPGFGEDKRGGTRPHLPKPGELITMPDARIPGFGTRFVAPLTDEYKASPAWKGPSNVTDWALPPPLQEIEALQSLPRVSTDHYHIRRFLTGLPEGPREVVLGDSLPLECNMDLMRGIDFQKGCYVGQELTIRTKHTGVVRKRVLPVRLYNLDAGTAPSTLELVKEEGGLWAAHEIGAQNNLNVGGIRPASGLFSEPNVPKPAEGEEPDPKEVAKEVAKELRAHRRQNRAVGRFLNGIGNVGLALCRLDAMTDVRTADWAEEQASLGRTYAADEHFGFTWRKKKDDEHEVGVGVKAFVPSWHRERMAEEQQARAEERRRRRAAVEAGHRVAEQAEFDGSTSTRHKRRDIRHKAKLAMNAALRGEEVPEASVWDTVDETAEERAERLARAEEEEKYLQDADEETNENEDDADYQFPLEKGITHRLNKEQLKLLSKERKKRLKAKRGQEEKHKRRAGERKTREAEKRERRMRQVEGKSWTRDQVEGKSWMRDDEETR